MKVLVIENSLDDLLNVKISVNGGQSYTDYNVSSLKNGGLTLDCNPSDLKVICDTNILNYIKVFADGEKLNAGSGGVSEDKLLCYAMYRGRGYTSTIYTDKPATQMNIGMSQSEVVILPQDEGKHLFITNIDLMNEGNTDYINLIYEDGSSISLKGKILDAVQYR